MPNSTASHTATPWQVKRLDVRHEVIAGADGMSVGSATFLRNGDAAHAVKCVNAHDELVASLTQFVDEYIETYGDEGDDFPELVSKSRALLASLAA